MRKVWSAPAGIVACAVLVGSAAPAVAAPGDLDMSFGGDGVVVTAEAGTVLMGDVVPAADGVIEFSGSGPSDGPSRWSVRRRLGNGALDPNFGDGGVPEGASLFTLFSGAIDRQGRLVAVGASGDSAEGGAGQLAVARYLPDGTLDRSFSDDGVSFLEFPTATSAAGTQLVLDDAGGYVVVARLVTRGDDGRQRFPTRLIRLDGSGPQDHGFGDDGAVRVPTLAYLTSDVRGRLVVTNTKKVGRRRVGVVRRFHSDGRVDRAFGSRGTSVLRRSGSVFLNSVATSGSKIVLAIGVGVSQESPAAVAVLNSSGALDRRFSGDGYRLLPDRRGPNTYAWDVAVDRSRRIVVGGWTGRSASHSRPMIVRLRQFGRLDGAFGDGGVRTFRVRTDPVDNAVVAVGKDNRIYLGGDGGGFRAESGFIARLLG